MGLTRFLFAAAALLVAAFAAPPPAAADRYEARVAVFYDDLAPYGRWVEHRVYGTVWLPASGAPDWHPYTYGRWVWTSDYGWYWDSDEDFAWATYHYGRWVLTAEYGWAWVPDDVWGPCWVDWRYGDGYVGWSPMPPEYRWRNGAFVAASIELDSPRYQRNWVFVAEKDFVAADIRTRRMPVGRSSALLTTSVRATNYATVNGRIVNRSIDRARIATAARVRIDPVRIGVANSTRDSAKIRAGGSVPLYRPHVRARTKVDGDATVDYSTPPTRFETDTHVDVPSTPRVDSGVDAEAGAATSIETERPLGRGGLGIGGGGGGGLGGGLRLGH